MSTCHCTLVILKKGTLYSVHKRPMTRSRQRHVLFRFIRPKRTGTFCDTRSLKLWCFLAAVLPSMCKYGKQNSTYRMCTYRTVVLRLFSKEYYSVQQNRLVQHYELMSAPRVHCTGIVLPVASCRVGVASRNRPFLLFNFQFRTYQ